MSDAAEDVRPYTVRLELVDRPGELLRALDPIADNGGNLLSIFHERGNVTPRGQIPVEVDLEATPEQFDAIVEGLRAEDIDVIQAGAERYSEELSVILVGHLVDTDLSNTLTAIQESTGSSVQDFSLSAPDGTDGESSARLRLAIRSGKRSDALEEIRGLAADKGLRLVEPLAGGESE